LSAASSGLKTKICLLGERQVGKSALVRRYLLDQFSDEYFATLGMKVYKKQVFIFPPKSKNAVEVTMVLWDIMGDGEYGESMRDIYLHGAAGIMAVADVTRPDTIPPLNRWINPALQQLGDVPVQIILNKWDAGEAEYARDMGRGIAKKHISPCYLTSALKGDNVERAFIDLAQRILAQAQVTSRPLSEDRMLELLVDSIGEARTLEDLSAEFGLPTSHAEPRIRNLVKSGYLVLKDVDIAPDGCPVMTYTATGKLAKKSY
jgi:small GTP-binding protein